MAHMSEPSVHVPPRSATWRQEHRWGPQFTDVTSYSITRRENGGLTINSGGKTVDIPTELLNWFAGAVHGATHWVP